MRLQKSFWFTTLAVIALGLVTGATVADRILHKPVHYGEAAWAEVFKHPQGLARTVDAIVLAQAMDVTPGRIALSDNGEGPLPFQVVNFEVLRSLKGAFAGDLLTVERAGGVDAHGHAVQITADGGDFVPGEIYLLFLKQQADGPHFFQVNFQGRYTLKGDHFIAVSPDDPVATRFHGASLEQGLARVDALLGPTRPNVPFEK